VGARRASALAPGLSERPDRARRRLRDERFEALQQIERAERANERCERRSATALEALHGRQRHSGAGGELPLGHVVLEPQPTELAANPGEDGAIIQLAAQRHNASF
jgi:hypothetical protein